MKRTSSPSLRSLKAASRPPMARRGTTIIIAMVVLLILAMIGATLISCVIQSRSQFVREEQHLQAALIADAGLGRAVAQLRIDRAFAGETWQIPAEKLTETGPASVVITVADAADDAGQRIISATVEYPLGTLQPIRLARELRIPNQPPP